MSELGADFLAFFLWEEDWQRARKCVSTLEQESEAIRTFWARMDASKSRSEYNFFLYIQLIFLPFGRFGPERKYLFVILGTTNSEVSEEGMHKLSQQEILLRFLVLSQTNDWEAWRTQEALGGIRASDGNMRI